MKRTIGSILAVLVALAVALPGAAQEAARKDVESIDAIMSAVYDVISGPAGEARDWDRWRTLFAPGASLSQLGRNQSGQYQRLTMTPDSYVERSGAMLERDGFFETELHRVTESFGMIAHAFSTYESRRTKADPEPFMRGINSFQLMNDGTRWWVVSIYWQGESPAHPIPAKYIGG